MKSPAKVSVIVLVYNAEKYIERCACSLFEQTLEEIEYIFVNDCTPDRSMDILKEVMEKYPQRKFQVQLLNLPVNGGSAIARNRGLKKAGGEYIIFCDSDDWVEKDMYEAMYTKVVAENADMVVCGYFAEYTRKQVYYRQACPDDSESCLRKLLTGSLHNSLCNKLIRKELYQKLPFWCQEGVNMWEDVTVTTRLAFYSRKTVFLSPAYYHYSQQSSQTYTHSWRVSTLENIVKAVDITEAFFRDEKSMAYAEELLWLKVRAKYSLLQNAPVIQRKLYRKIYPESDPMIFSHPALPFYGKIMLWCRIHAMDRIADMMLRGVALIKKWSR